VGSYNSWKRTTIDTLAPQMLSSVRRAVPPVRILLVSMHGIAVRRPVNLANVVNIEGHEPGMEGDIRRTNRPDSKIMAIADCRCLPVACGAARCADIVDAATDCHQRLGLSFPLTAALEKGRRFTQNRESAFLRLSVCMSSRRLARRIIFRECKQYHWRTVWEFSDNTDVAAHRLDGFS